MNKNSLKYYENITDADLYNILQHKDEYSKEQLETIFSLESNIMKVAKSSYKYMYKKILELNIPKLNYIYMNEHFLFILKTLGKLGNVYDYNVINNQNINTSMLVLNQNVLINIGESILQEYNEIIIKSAFRKPDINFCHPYNSFICSIPNLNDKNLLFEVLDFYLTNIKYLTTFNILRNRLDQITLQEYLNSRKELISKIIQQNPDNYNIVFILQGLPYELLNKEFSKKRENFLIYCSELEISWIFKNNNQGNYKVPKHILKNDKFLEKFISCPLFEIERLISLVTDNDEDKKQLISKISSLVEMQKDLQKRLNDTYEDFKDYILILMNSSLDVYNIDFLKDMIDVCFLDRRIEEVFYKYEGVNLEKIKLQILNDIIKKSRDSIVNSLTNPLTKNAVYCEYILDGKKVQIPTIIYDHEKYIFMARRVDTGKYDFDKNIQGDKDKLSYYSVINENNRSMFYGDSGVKCGYISVNPLDIVQVNSFDAITQSSREGKYIQAYVKYPEWVTIDELNERTFENKSYSEIRIKGYYIPDFVIAYDEPNENTLRCSYENDVPIVRILRKGYPNAIEFTDDPYKHWN